MPKDPTDTPGETEFSWGGGRMADPEREPPSESDQLRMAHRVNLRSDDPEAIESYDGEFEPRPENGILPE